MRSFLTASSLVFLSFAGISAPSRGRGRLCRRPAFRRRPSPSSLPKPYATAAVENSSQGIARPSGALPQAPNGFAVSLFADNLTNPRWMAVAPNGDVFLAEPDGNRITLLRDAKGTGHADVRKIYATAVSTGRTASFSTTAIFTSAIPRRCGAFLTRTEISRHMR